MLPKITAGRLLFVSVAVFLVAPFLWAVWWIPCYAEHPLWCFRGVWWTQALWYCGPIIAFPCAMACMTYFAWKIQNGPLQWPYSRK